MDVQNVKRPCAYAQLVSRNIGAARLILCLKNFAEYLDLGNMFCQNCSVACKGCSGPTFRECTGCADRHYKQFDDAGER